MRLTEELLHQRFLYSNQSRNYMAVHYPPILGYYKAETDHYPKCTVSVGQKPSITHNALFL